jgi:hypothetical protein
VFDHFGDFKAIPAPLFLAQYRIGRDVEFEDTFHFAHLRATRHEPDYQSNTGEEDQHHG